MGGGVHRHAPALPPESPPPPSSSPKMRRSAVNFRRLVSPPHVEQFLVPTKSPSLVPPLGTFDALGGGGGGGGDNGGAAAPLFKLSVAIRKKVFGEAHPPVSVSRSTFIQFRVVGGTYPHRTLGSSDLIQRLLY